MKEHPIIFSSPMVRAILDNRKSQTRRVMKPQPTRICDVKACLVHTWHGSFRDENGFLEDRKIKCPYGQVGDRLWVRETWAYNPDFVESARQICYRADTGHEWGKIKLDDLTWKPSIHMPRWASRIILEIIKIRVERVQEVSNEDAKAEGLYDSFKREKLAGGLTVEECDRAEWKFIDLWDSINGKREGCSWDSNPYVWVIEFKAL